MRPDFSRGPIQDPASDLPTSGALELPLCHKGRQYCAVIHTGSDGWRVTLSDENGVELPASGDFAATLLALEA